jgi:parallel beta-helix repeat protein
MEYLIKVHIVACLCLGTSAMATDYYVNPTGNDLWSGTKNLPNTNKTDGPFKTLERAQKAIRTLKKKNAFNSKVTVNIANGAYYLSKPLNFNLLDTGLPDKEILWQGEPGAQVNISAGLPITCTKHDPMLWSCPLSKLPSSTSYFDTGRMKGNTPKFELYVNDQKLELARWPDKDWAHIKSPLDQQTQFSVMETLPNLIGDISAAQVHIFAGNDWFDQYIGINSVDHSSNSIKLTSPTSYVLDSGRRFYIQNLPSLLNVPGEWIYEYDQATKKVNFIPPTGITPKVVMLSSLPNIMIMEDISYVAFKNLNFQHSTGTAIIIKNSKNIDMDQLDVNNIGGKGIQVRNSQNVRLFNSQIHHTGAEGVEVSGGDRKTLQASGNIIHNNHIHHNGAILLAHSPSIRLGGVGIKVTHNLLNYGPATGIILLGNDHLIEKNEFHDFCLQALDCGAFYSGRDWSSLGNVVRYNYIHDIIGYGLKSLDVAKNQVVYQSPAHASAIYLDDGASGFEVNGNIIENVGLMGLQLGGGRNNKIVNNYFKTNEYAIWIDDRWPRYDWSQNQKYLDDSPYKTLQWQKKYSALVVGQMQNKTWPEGNRIERNVIVTGNPTGLSFRYYVPLGSTVIKNNLIWSLTGKLTVDYKILELNKKEGGAWSKWVAQGIEQGSILDDPCVTIRNKIMATCLGSPVKKIGFEQLPTDIGLIP